MQQGKAEQLQPIRVVKTIQFAYPMIYQNFHLDQDKRSLSQKLEWKLS